MWAHRDFVAAIGSEIAATSPASDAGDASHRRTTRLELVSRVAHATLAQVGDDDRLRIPIGSACVVFDDEGHVLLVRHTYGRLNWELPGGGGKPGESPDETAIRELVEETAVDAVIDRLTGVYHELGHPNGPMLHFVFRCRLRDGSLPVAASPEVSDARYWPVDALPTPISDFTERRIQDGLATGPVRIQRVAARRWRD